MRVPERVWKLLGLAGLAGVAATGAVLVRGERQRRAYTPDDVRARLHQRHAAAAAVPGPGEEPPGPVRQGLRSRLRRRR
ncbi:hypothetical protein JD79_02750 [Geodermatophilus normandii]|uniref:Uncharacterized protein n=1 Tax=Geodermatophilus normandii TaxID=1137989 RepID=A0A317QMZ1_9ACTN|nr:hypothetical protein [Geodermatophilus normandii]PWW23575.1 hypothetical protein JD79_02750 [Geodermatophilus normandii]